MAEDCLFCRIAAGDVEADVVAEGRRWVAFRDADPQAPVHVLVIPREHVTHLDALGDDQRRLAGELLLAARDVARAEGLAGEGYRLVANTGREGGQSVFHLHFHVLGGRGMGWPPG